MFLLIDRRSGIVNAESSFYFIEIPICNISNCAFILIIFFYFRVHIIMRYGAKIGGCIVV